MGQAKIRGTFEQRKKNAMRKHWQGKVRNFFLRPRNISIGLSLTVLSLFMNEESWLSSVQFGAGHWGRWI